MATYTGATESTQVDTAVRPPSEDATAVITFLDFPLDQAACSSIPIPLDDWLPDTEEHRVPEQLLQVCASCPVRQQCLTWATLQEEQGYWAGSTSRQRRRLLRTATEISVPALEAIDARPEATHAAGMGSEWRYRQGCRCHGCLTAHRHTRARERNRERDRHTRKAQP